MGHRSAKVYQSYINEVAIHAQLVFLGKPQADDLLREISTMGWRRDPRAPTELTTDERESLKKNPSILELKDELRQIQSRLENLHIDDSERDRLAKRTRELGTEVQRTRVALFRKAKRLKRKQYFDTVDIIAIEKQLNHPGQEDKEDDHQPPQVTYQLPAREAVVRCLYDGLKDLDEEAAWERRKQAMLAFEALIQQHEPPRAIRQQRGQKKKKKIVSAPLTTFHQQGQQKVATANDPKLHAPSVPRTYSSYMCIFCYNRKGKTWTERTRTFKSSFSAARHVENMHLKFWNFEKPLSCPDDLCHAMCDDKMHFKAHAAEVHRYFLNR
jgi:Protein of unknown function (DUF3435)